MIVRHLPSVRSLGTLALITAVLGATVPATAASTLITSRPALGGNDTVDWGQLGPAFTSVGPSANVVSAGGVNINVSEDRPGFERRDQGNGWSGNFASGDALLWSTGHGPATLTFGTNVSAAGFQIQDDYFGAFTATISAYDSSNNLLGTFNEAGVSTSNSDNSAIFIGIKDTSADIAKIVVNADRNDFAINKMDIATNPVPEASSILGLGSLVSLSGLFLMRRRRA